MPEKFKNFYNANLKGEEFFETESDFVDFNIESLIPRTEIGKIIYLYIRHNNLYNKKEDGTYDKRAIKPDDQLKLLFSLNEDEMGDVTFNTFQKYMSRMYKSDTVLHEVVKDTV